MAPVVKSRFRNHVNEIEIHMIINVFETFLVIGRTISLFTRNKLIAFYLKKNTLENIEGAKGQSGETGNIGYT